MAEAFEFYPEVDVLESAARTREEEERQKLAEAQAAQQKQQQEQQQEQQKQQQFQESLVSPLPQELIPNIGRALGDMLGQAVTGATPEQAARAREELEKRKSPVEKVLDETSKVITGAFVKPIEGVIDTGYQFYLNNTVNKGKSPGEEGYKRAYTQLVSSPKSDIGTASEYMLSNILTMYALRKIPGAGFGKSPMPKDVKGLAKVAAKGKRLVTDGLVPGAITDFLLADAKDGNFLAIVEKMVPEEWRDAWIFALATDEGTESDPLMNRVKSLGEGALLTNPVFNAAAPALGIARRTARRVFKSTGDKDKAVEAGIEAGTKAADENMSAFAKNATAESTAQIKAKSAEVEKVEAQIERKSKQLMNEFDPEESKKLSGEIENLNAKREDLLNQIDDEVLPESKTLSYENGRSVETTDINDVAVNQLKLEVGTPGKPKISVHGASGKVMTDSALNQMTTEGAKKAIRRFENKIDTLGISKRSGLTRKQVLDNAAEILKNFNNSIQPFNSIDITDQDKLVQDILKRVGNVATTAKGEAVVDGPTLVATKAILADLANDVYNLAQVGAKFDKDNVTGFNTFDMMVDRLTGLLELYKESTQFFGGNLNAIRHTLLGGEAGERAAKFSDQFEADEDSVISILQIKRFAQDAKDAYRRGDADGLEKMRTLARAMILSGGDPGKTLNFAETALSAFNRTQAKVFYNSILSGVKTFIRNTSTSYRVVEAPLSIYLKGFATGDDALKNAGLAGFSAIRSSMSDALRIAKVTYDKRIPANTTSEYIIRNLEIPAMLENLEITAQTASAKFAVGVLRGYYRFSEWGLVSYPEKIMMSTDEFFKHIMARQKIAEMAAYQATKEAPSNWKAVTAKRLEVYSNFIDPNTGAIKNKKLQEYAAMGAYQDDPGRMANAIANALDQIPLARYMVPFVRTPANIMAYQMQHIPGYSALGKIPGVRNFFDRARKAYESNDPLLIAEIEGRQATGGMFMGMAAMGASAGLITGDIPDPRTEPAEYKRWKENNIRPRSFKFGNVYISYNALEPVSNLMAASANFIRAVQTYGISPEQADRYWNALGMTVAGSFLEKSYFDGLTQAAALMDSNNWTSEGALRGSLNYLNNNLPWASMRRAIGNSLDGDMRLYTDEWDRFLQTAIPLYRNTRPEAISVFTGKALKNPNGNPINANVPFEVSIGMDDPVINMLADIEYRWKDDLDKGKYGIKLTAEEQKFFRVAMYDLDIYGRLKRLMEKDSFKEYMNRWNNRSFNPEDREFAKTMKPLVYEAVAAEWKTVKDAALEKLYRDDAAGKRYRQELIKRTQLKGLFEAGETNLKIKNLQEYHKKN